MSQLGKLRAEFKAMVEEAAWLLKGAIWAIERDDYYAAVDLLSDALSILEPKIGSLVNLGYRIWLEERGLDASEASITDYIYGDIGGNILRAYELVDEGISYLEREMPDSAIRALRTALRELAGLY